MPDPFTPSYPLLPSLISSDYSLIYLIMTLPRVKNETFQLVMQFTNTQFNWLKNYGEIF